MTISLCVTCRDRLYHLRRTLPSNLRWAKKDGDVQIVLLDYNSSDGLEDWIRNTYKEDIKSGLLVFYRESKATRFNMMHAKNVAANLAIGSVVVNLDADNFIGPYYLSFLRNAFADENVQAAKLKCKRGLCGRIAIRKKMFVKLGGYDESMPCGYGWEDLDLLERMGRLNLTVREISDKGSDYIEHSDGERMVKIDPSLSREDANAKNMKHSQKNIAALRYVANAGKEWGKAKVSINFSKVSIKIKNQ